MRSEGRSRSVVEIAFEICQPLPPQGAFARDGAPAPICQLPLIPSLCLDILRCTLHADATTVRAQLKTGPGNDETQCDTSWLGTTRHDIGWYMSKNIRGCASSVPGFIRHRGNDSLFPLSISMHSSVFQKDPLCVLGTLHLAATTTRPMQH